MMHFACPTEQVGPLERGAGAQTRAWVLQTAADLAATVSAPLQKKITPFFCATPRPALPRRPHGFPHHPNPPVSEVRSPCALGENAGPRVRYFPAWENRRGFPPSGQGHPRHRLRQRPRRFPLRELRRPKIGRVPSRSCVCFWRMRTTNGASVCCPKCCTAATCARSASPWAF